ncbi:hypothetical protein CC80DRAFT_192995 [Byssothecium circinans]|uniref:Uncharacterized protein n=1 Tax=Byssothecium circinans TaxID=147558 RepID=A0A6A5TFZ9_9PLEO|nr:hypothetical protein CC80DRAFT_192995 [Byssothecium circinans]
MDDRTGTRLPRDIAETIYSALPSPSRALDLSSAHPRTSSIPAKRLQDTPSGKRKGSATDGCSTPPQISFAPLNGRAYRIAQKASKRSRLQLQNDQAQPDLHQSTCLNLNVAGAPGNDESELWILPDFDEWEVEADVSQPETPRGKGSEWAPLVERAVNSNRERLRRRLEGDGWDFVCGRYGEDGKMLKEMADAGEESVDEEFDVVVLPMLQVSC